MQFHLCPSRITLEFLNKENLLFTREKESKWKKATEVNPNFLPLAMQACANRSMRCVLSGKSLLLCIVRKQLVTVR